MRASATPVPAETEIEPPAVPGISGLMTLIVAVVVLAALYIGQDVFLPVVMAILLAFVLAPFVDWMRRWHLGRVPSVIIAVMLALGIIVSLGGLIGVQVAGLATDLPRYQATIKEKVGSLRAGTIGRLPAMLKEFNKAVEEAPKEPDAANAPAAQPAPPEPGPLPVEVHEREATPLQLAQSIAVPLLKPLTTTGIVFVVLVFILLQREDLRDRMIRLFGSSDLHRTTGAMDDAARRLSRYFLIQLGLNAAFGVLIGLGLWAIGIPSPALWGVFAAVMRFVPYIGSFVAAAFPIVLASAVDPGWSMVGMTTALFLISEPVMGHVIEPLVYGKSTGLSPFAVVISAIFWTWMWGPVGLLIATPLTLCLVVLGRHVERLEFLDVLLGDRPALTPAENLYQRMLVGDPDEALESAEILLKDRSLTSYYDEVAVSAIQLAANDARRGVMTSQQIQHIKDVAHSLVLDLNGHDDNEPDAADTKDEPVAPPASEKPSIPDPATQDLLPLEGRIPAEWSTEGAILCVAGRGALDDAAAEMFGQLLTKHGLGTRVVPHEAVGRSTIADLDVTGVRMIVLCYVEILGTPAHLRYLIRRLRTRAREASLMVGLWPSDHPVFRDESIRAAVGADHYVGSLRDGVVRSLQIATGEEVQQPEASVVTLRDQRANGSANRRIRLPA